MISADTLFSYPYCTSILTAHNDAYDKQLGAVISQNSKPIALFSKISINPQSD